MTYNDGKIEYSDVKIPQTIFKQGPLGVENSITYNGDSITSIQPKVINAVDIDWNGAQVNGRVLKKTGDLLDWINSFNKKTSFEIWKENELKSGKSEEYLTEENFIESLKGEQGPTGPQGEQGPKGDIGPQGKSAFELAKENGYSGNNEKEWLKSLIPKLNVGTVSVNQSSTASVNIAQNGNEVIFNFTLPAQSSTPIDINLDKYVQYEYLYGYLSDYALISELKENYVDKDTYNEGMNSKQNKLVSENNIRCIQYPNDINIQGNYKKISLLPDDDGNTSITSDPNFNQKDTSEYSSGNTITMSKVAFTGRYNDLLGRPDEDKYIKIFRKSLREEANTYYPDRDSIQRVVYELRGSGEKSEIAREGINTYTKSECNEYNRNNIGVSAWMYYISGSPNDIQLYTVEQAASYNSQLEGAIISGTQLTDIQASLVNDILKDTTYTAGEKITDAHSRIYNQSLEGHVEPDNNNFYHPDDEVTAHNLGVQGAYTIKTLKQGVDSLNRHFESAFIQNQVYGDHSVALGWGCQVGNKNNGNHSFAEGKWTNVQGNFSHASGFRNKVEGDYSYSGGLNLDKGNVIGNYSFSYGKNLITYNNGEIAFGEFNKSKSEGIINNNQDFEKKIRRPEKDRIISDFNQNYWKIIDFYNITLQDFEDYIDLDFEDYISGKKGYDFGYNNNNSNYQSFIDNIFSKNCSVVEDYNSNDYSNNVKLFLKSVIFDINCRKSIYSYQYIDQEGSGNPGNIQQEGCIVGVIAQKVDKNGNQIQNEQEQYEFFIWGPDYLYYNDNPITKFSIGNGTSEDNRNNLVEVTSDGDIYYKNGNSHLFGLESDLNDLRNTIGSNIEKLDNIADNDPSININDSTSSIIVLDKYLDNDSHNLQITLNVSESSQNYYKKTLIIDLSKFSNNTGGSNAVPTIKFKNSNNSNIRFLFKIDTTDGASVVSGNNSLFELALANGLNDFKDYVYQIEIEVVYTDCFVNVKTYSIYNND